ncbi:MAG: hypothetical protein Q4E67_08490 [Planctomycetia bacterium]|nr:hypothetical protein [Planctomycetia bacterium]
MERKWEAKDILCAIASFIIPGLGQIIKTRFVPGIVWFLCAVGANVLGFRFLSAENLEWVPGIIVALFSAVNAAK